MTTATVAAKKASNFTDAQVAAIQAAAPVNQAKAKELAASLGLKEKSIIAKATRMGIYVAKGKVTKTGSPVERKEAIVEAIANIIETNLDGLEKAPKPALQAIRDYLASLDDGDEAVAA